MDNHAIKAHHIARHLRAIAKLLVDASEDTWRDYVPGSESVKPGFLDMLTRQAERVEARYPVEPVPDDEKAELAEAIGEQLRDRSFYEAVEDHTQDWTEADWRAEKDDYDEYMAEDEA